jgi:N-acetylglucosaminyldiphosphoundecaprenol N-acetyl-beta-D-mannosaminyltransferase
MNKITIASIPINLFTVDTLHLEIHNAILKNEKTVFLHVNAYLLQLAHTSEKWLIDFFIKTDYSICDGAGIQLAAKLTRQPVPEKIAFNVWMPEFINFLAKNNLSIFFLGADHKTVMKAKQKMEILQPNINIKGVNHGYFNKQKDNPENLDVIKKINELKPHVLLVGFGMPIQERWVKENMDLLQVNAIFTCGGIFDFISGNKPVAPKIFRLLYLEWLFRAILEPGRLFKRNIKANLYSVYYILKYNIFTK